MSNHDLQALQVIARECLDDEVRSTLQLVAHQLGECAPYQKEGETPAQCIARNRKDLSATLGMLADEKKNSESLQEYLQWSRALLLQAVPHVEASGDGELENLLRKFAEESKGLISRGNTAQQETSE